VAKMKFTKPIKALIIEDDPGDLYLIREILSETEIVRVDLDHTGRLSAGVKMLESRNFDIILTDLQLPDSTGMATFFTVHSFAPDTPIIVLSGLHDEELAIKAVREGAQDYLVKGSFDGRLLIRSILYSIERKKLLIQLENSLREIKTLKGLIPVCAWCRKLRDDDGYWKKLETYFTKHTNAEFTHGICPECASKEREKFEKIRKGGSQ
jgi:DNA-binding NtrC family response regulator